MSPYALGDSSVDALGVRGAVVLQNAPAESFLTVLFGGLCFLCGLIFIRCGTGRYRKGALIRNTARETVRSVSLGRTALEGVARPHENTIERPFDRGRCVYVSWEMEKKGDDGWGVVARDTHSERFLLEDETGAVLVEDPHTQERETIVDHPRGANVVECDPTGVNVTISDANTLQTTVESGARPPEPIVEWCRERDVSPVADSKRRYTQKIIPPGGDVYVFGQASRGEDLEGADYRDDRIIELDEGSGLFVLADGSRDAVVSTFHRSVPVYLAGGLVLGAVGLYALVGGL